MPGLQQARSLNNDNSSSTNQNLIAFFSQFNTTIINDLYLESGASTHMTANLDQLQQSALYHELEEVMIGNGSS